MMRGMSPEAEALSRRILEELRAVTETYLPFGGTTTSQATRDATAAAVAQLASNVIWMCLTETSYVNMDQLIARHCEYLRETLTDQYRGAK